MEKTCFLLRDERIRKNLKAFIDSLPTDSQRPLEIIAKRLNFDYII